MPGSLHHQPTTFMCDQIIEFVSSSLSIDLSAYRKTYSCNDVLVKCVENWRKALDNNCHVGCILIDLSKAFDSLPHGLLIAKLHAYGLSCEACSFILDYLKNRKQIVKLGNIKCEWLNLKTGVPQSNGHKGQTRSGFHLSNFMVQNNFI